MTRKNQTVEYVFALLAAIAVFIALNGIAYRSILYPQTQRHNSHERSWPIIRRRLFPAPRSSAMPSLTPMCAGSGPARDQLAGLDPLAIVAEQ